MTQSFIESPDVPPEGRLIAAGLKKVGFSQREAARRARISESRWRQIVSGYQSVSGRKAPVRGPDRTLARMALAVKVTPEDLEEAGRSEAAALLRSLEADRRAAGSVPAAASGAADRLDERWHVVRATLRGAGEGLTAAEYHVLADRVADFFDQAPGPAGRDDLADPFDGPGGDEDFEE